MAGNEKEEKRVPKLMGSKFQQDANYARMRSFATIPNGTTIQDMKAPEFWSSVAGKLQARGRIEVEPEDGSFIAEFAVRAVGPNWARVELLHHHQFASAATLVQKAKDFKVEWGGPAHKHRVIRLSDKEVLKFGFETPEMAAEWLVANQAAMTA